MKTPITYSTNREIGGVAPSKYLSKIETKGQVTTDVLNGYLESHFLNVDCCRNDNFEGFILDRAKHFLDIIEVAMGKTISGRESEEVVNAFGAELI